MRGKIIKGIAGFYYIHVDDQGVYECKAKGAFRNDKIKPMVGDNVQIDVIDEEQLKGNIVKILPRKNELIRPAVANVDQAMIIFAIKDPIPNLNMLDRFLIMMAQQGVDTIICFNKMDIAKEDEMKRLKDIYSHSGYQVIFTSIEQGIGIEAVESLLKAKTTVMAGPSGVGKSSMMNYLYPKAKMEVGNVSEKIKRGKHTTRHSEIFAIDKDSYVIDTPGFTSLVIMDMEENELKDYFSEFLEHEHLCRFNGCLHLKEPKCGVKEALEKELISPVRYENYKNIYHEIKDRRKY